MRTRSITNALVAVIALAEVAFVGGIVAGVVHVGTVGDTGSMRPNLTAGDFVVGTTAGDVETVHEDGSGDVVVFDEPGRDADVVHRTHFRVEEGENWYDRADTDYLAGADNCRELRYCPAPHDGFVTKGDSNAVYDQAAGIPPVKHEWLVGRVVFSASF